MFISRQGTITKGIVIFKPKEYDMINPNSKTQITVHHTIHRNQNYNSKN